ncbi:MAG: hypothetical protein J0M02_00655 [Planctomycetes bacterium]|nr:hypothetical protein [Planctomycetota bacterium]
MRPLLALWILLSLLPGAEPGINPRLQRLDLHADQVAEVAFTLALPAQTSVSAVVANCACIRTLTTLPIQADATGAASIRLRVTGMRPGMEDILVATSAGILRAQVQIVGPGAGRGLDQLQIAMRAAANHGWHILAIAHDLRGRARHCGCSHGALGGIGRLAQLPRLATELQPQVTASWILTGDVDGQRTGVGAALSASGWLRADPRVLVTAEPLAALTAPGIVAVIPTVPVAAEHRRLIRPVLTDGMAVEMLLVDAAGAVQARHTVPIDDSIPDDAALERRFDDPLSVTIRTDAQPSTACAGCHASAFATWKLSRHARALDSLAATDRTDTCIGCHVTTTASAIVAPGVSCQSCHTGSDAHVAAAGSVRTTGTVQCRSCHDARHHPTFTQDAAWPMIQHGR